METVLIARNGNSANWRFIRWVRSDNFMMWFWPYPGLQFYNSFTDRYMRYVTPESAREDYAVFIPPRKY
jgi:hypothetical protein